MFQIWSMADRHGPVNGEFGGDDRDRTGDLRLAKPALSQLSYVPTGGRNIGRAGGAFQNESDTRPARRIEGEN